MCIGIDYLDSLKALLFSYNPFFTNKDTLSFIFDNKKIDIFNNGYALVCIENLKGIHVVPVMLSCTDVFMFTFIKNRFPLDKPINYQYSIFDFL